MNFRIVFVCTFCRHEQEELAETLREFQGKLVTRECEQCHARAYLKGIARATPLPGTIPQSPGPPTA